MKSAVFRFIFCALTLTLAPAVSRASTLYWEGTGNGNWDTTSAVWHLDSPGGTLVAWDNAGNHDAVFEGTGGTITLGPAISARSISLATNDFVLTSGVLTLSTGLIDTAAGTTATIASGIGGPAGLTKTGAGVLIVRGSNSYAGETLVSAGTLRLGAAATAPPTPATQWVADSLSGADGSSVTTWTDSILGRNATTFTNAPKLNTASLVNGHQTVKFTPNQALQIAPGSNPISGAVDFTVAIVFKPYAVGASGAQWYQNTGLVDCESSTIGASDWGFAWNSEGKVGAGIGNPDSTHYSAALALNTFHVAIYSKIGNTIRIVADGTTTSRTVSNSGVARASLRCLFGSLEGANYFNGEIAEVQMFNTTITVQTLDSVYAHLAAKYLGSGAGTIPANSKMTVADGATFDLSGFNAQVAGLSGSGSVTLGTATLNVVAGSDGSFDGVVSGTGSFTKAGSGTLTLGNANTYSGTTTVSAGRLRAGVSNPIAAASPLVLQNSAAFDLNSFSCAVGSLTGSAATTVLLGGSAGTMLIVGGNNDSTTFGGVISGTGGIEKAGSGTWSLGNAQAYSGATQISAGTLKLLGAPQDASAYYSFDDVAGATVRNGGTAGSAKDGQLANGAAVTTGGGGVRGEGMQIPDTGNQGSNNARMTIPLSSNRGIDLNGGNWTASAWFNGLFGPKTAGNPTGNWRTLFRGNVADEQVIIRDTTTALGVWQSGAGGFHPAAPAFDMSSVSTGWHMVTSVGSGTTTTLYIDGIQVGVSDVKSVADIAVIGNNGASPWQPFARFIDDVYIFQRALNSSEVATLYAGNSVLPTTTVVILSGTAVMNLNGVRQVVGSVAGASSSQIQLGGAALTAGADNSDSEFAGVVSEYGNLTKAGSGAFTLNGNNTYRGTTTVAGGRLIAAHANALGTMPGNVLVQSGAQLAINLASPATVSLPLTLNGDGGGSGALLIQQSSVVWNAAVTLASDAMINTAPTTDLTLSQNLSGAGGLSKNGAGTLVVSGASSYAGPTGIFSGTLQLDGTFASANSVAVASGATLRPGAAGMSMSGLSINDSGILSLRLPTAVNAPKLTVNGTATFGALSILQMDLAGYPDGVGSSFTIVDAQTLPAHIGSMNKVNDAGAPETPVLDYVNGARQTAVLTLNDVPATTVATTDTSIEFRGGSQTLTLSATVTSPGGPVNTGTVSFQIKQGSTNIGSVATSQTVNNGAASAIYTIPAGTSVGQYTISLSYSGAANFKPGSDSSKTLTITRAGTTATPANAGTTYSFADQTVSLSIQVTSAAGVVNEGTVTVQLKSGAQDLGAAATSAAITAGTASVNYVIPGGTQQGAYSIQASYSGGVNFAASSDSSKTVTIQKATPVITWANPADIAYGTALGAAQLNAGAGGIPGTFIYNPPGGTFMAVGSGQQLAAAFTPNDSVNYNSAQKTVAINVTRKVLTVTADNQSKLFGAANPTLTASYSGFANGETAAVLVGAPALSTAVTASTPPGNYPILISQGTLNAANYTFTFVNGTLTVSNQPGLFELSAPNVPYGTPTTALSGKISFGVTGAVNITLNGVSKSAAIDASGFFSANFNTASLEIGTYPIQYSYPGGGAIGPASDTRTLTVIKATPAITWANPAEISYGTQLSSTQLNATANVAGTFAYTPAAGTVLTKGTHQLSTNFTPADSAHYISASASVTLVVGLAQAAITWATPADISYGTALTDAQFNATADIAGTFTYSPPSGTILDAGDVHKLSLTFAPDDNVNYATSHVDVFINVLKADQSIAFPQIADQEIGNPALTVSASATSNFPVTITLVSGNATLQDGTLTLTGLGAITLRAEQAGDANFNAAPALEQTFNVVIIPPHLTSAFSAGGTQGQTFTFTLAASGTKPVTFESGTLPPGLSLNSNTGEISGTPTASGAFQIAVTARNGAGTETKTLTLVFASSGGGENHAPKFTSGVLATPNPIAVNQEVNFSAFASDEDGDAVAIVWDFGDGAQGFGATAAHRYATSGVFAAKVTITDGARSDYLNVAIVVNGTVIPPDQYKQYVVSKLGLKLNFAKPNLDSLSISGTIPIPPAFPPEGKVVKFESAELEREWTLDKKAASSDKAFKLTGKFAKDGTLTGAPAKFALALKNQDLFTGLAPLGFLNDNTPKGMIVSMPVILLIEGTGYLATVDVKYAAKKDKSGTGKK